MKYIEVAEKINEFEVNEELYSFLLKLANIEKILINDEFRYLYLVSLISSDNSVDIESANKMLGDVKFLTENLKYINVSDKTKKEVLKYMKDAPSILKNDIKEFKKESKKVTVSKEPDYRNGYKEGYDGITESTFTF